MTAYDNIHVGLTLTLQKKVEHEDTSLNYGSGKIENLLATPRLVAFMIEASSRLIDPLLPEGVVSVGHHVEVEHFKPTMLGSTVSVEVKLVRIECGKYILSMRAYDEFGQIGTGLHTRSIIPLRKLEEIAEKREHEFEG